MRRLHLPVLFWLFHIASSCGFPGSPPNGLVTLSFRVAHYQCHPGFRLLGADKRFCDTKSKVWYPKLPSCVRDIAVSRKVVINGGNSLLNVTDGYNDTCSTVVTERRDLDLVVDLLMPAEIRAYNLVAFKLNGSEETAVSHRMFVQNNEDDLECHSESGSGSIALCKRILRGRHVRISLELNENDPVSTVQICRIEILSERAVTQENCGLSRQLVAVGGHCLLSDNNRPLRLSTERDRNKCLHLNGIQTPTQNEWQQKIEELLTLNLLSNNASSNDSFPVEDEQVDLNQAAFCSVSARRCSSPYIPVNAVNIADQSLNESTYSIGQKISYSCGTKTETIECQDSGFWTTGHLSCPFVRIHPDYEQPEPASVPCSVPDAPKSGSVVISSAADNSTVAQYLCDRGFKLRGNSNVIRCHNNGTWSGAAPACETIYCEQPKPLAFGSATLSRNSTAVGTQLFIRCNPDFILEGPSVLICMENGSWNGLWPVCKPVEKAKCPPVRAGEAEIVYLDRGRVAGHRAFVRCHSGFRLTPPVPAPVLECLNNGNWNSTLRCLPISTQTGVTERKPSRTVVTQTTPKNGSNWAFIVALVAIIALCIVSLVCGISLILVKKRRRTVAPQSVVPMVLPELPVLVRQHPSDSNFDRYSLRKSSSSIGYNHSFRGPHPQHVTTVLMHPSPVVSGPYPQYQSVRAQKQTPVPERTRRSYSDLSDRPVPPIPAPDRKVQLHEENNNFYERPNSSKHFPQVQQGREEIVVPVVSLVVNNSSSQTSETESEEQELPEDPLPQRSHSTYQTLPSRNRNSSTSSIHRRWSFSNESDLNPAPHYYYASGNDANAVLTIPRAVHRPTNRASLPVQHQSGTDSSDQEASPSRDLRRSSLPLETESPSRGSVYVTQPRTKRIKNKNQTTQAEANILLMDERNWSNLLQSNTFELDSSFLEPVKRDSYKPKLFNIANSNPRPATPASRPKLQVRRSSIQMSPKLAKVEMTQKLNETSTNTQNGAMWDAKKFKHRHKKVQFADTVKDA